MPPTKVLYPLSIVWSPTMPCACESDVTDFLRVSKVVGWLFFAGHRVTFPLTLSSPSRSISPSPNACDAWNWRQLYWLLPQKGIEGHGEQERDRSSKHWKADSVLFFLICSQVNKAFIQGVASWYSISLSILFMHYSTTKVIQRLNTLNVDIFTTINKSRRSMSICVILQNFALVAFYLPRNVSCPWPQFFIGLIDRPTVSTRCLYSLTLSALIRGRNREGWSASWYVDIAAELLKYIRNLHDPKTTNL